ncbi:MAG: galactokinase [Anaerolineaceae bacterium]|nr:galactokinase [Anaerolineaceae bacterium]
MDSRSFAIESFTRRFGKAPAYIAVGPGRVNTLGEHVDYNDGFVLPAAIDRATWLAFSPSNDGQTTLLAADFNEEVIFTDAGIAGKFAIDGSPLAEWARYPAGMAWALNLDGHETPAMHGAFSSNIPRGSGLSSSASIEMVFSVAWSALGGWELPAIKRAVLGQKAENQYVGVSCGIMDQFACACGVEDRLLLLDCRSLEWQLLPIPEDIAIVIADTGVRRKLTTSGYNERRQACEDAVKILAEDLPGIKALRDVNVEDFNRLAHRLPGLVEKRARHVVEEIERSQRAIPLLQAGHIAEFGQIMNDCHRSLRDLYEVSVDELNIMSEIAQSLPGCMGARLTGAGFGGCTVNLVQMDAVDEFAAQLALGYESKAKRKAEIYICRASDGASIVSG